MGSPGGGGSGSGGSAGGSSILSIGLSAYSSVLKGQGEQASANMRADKLEQAAAYGKVQAAETGAQLTEQLNTTLGNIDAIRAAAGIDPTSPTTAAIQDKQSFVSDRQRSTTVNNILQQARQNEADATYMRSAGSFALKQGWLSAGIDVAKGLASMGKPG